MPININNLFHVYNKKTEIENSALNGINVNFNDYFLTALVGQTGSGKSTLAQHLNYLLKPSEGTIEIDDFKISSIKKEMRRFKTKSLRQNVGYLFQFSENQIFSDTVIKEVMFGPLNFGFNQDEANKTAIEALTSVGIDESFYKKSPLELSGGEKRRIAIASVIACKPKYLILDEPTAGLDSEGKETLINILKDLYEAGTSILLITHDMDVVYSLCKDVIEMSEGKVVSNLNTYDYFMNKINDKNADIPEILRFCSVFEDERIKKCTSLDKLLEVLSNE